jgi:hypothetical protein
VSHLVVRNEMKRKIIISILAGTLYWLIDFVVIRLSIHYKIEYSNTYPAFLFFGVPFLIGVSLIFVIREKQLYSLLYAALLVIVEYVITLAEFSITSSRSPFAILPELLWLFKINGIYSTLLAMLGGLIALAINRWRLKTS